MNDTTRKSEKSVKIGRFNRFALCILRHAVCGQKRWPLNEAIRE